MCFFTLELSSTQDSIGFFSRVNGWVQITFRYGFKVGKKNPCQELSFPYRVVFILLYPTYNIKKNKSSLNQHFFFSGFSFDFNASTLFGSIIPLLEVLSQGVRTFLLARWDSNTNPKMHSKDLTAHIKNKQQKERKDGVGKSVWQNGKLKAVFQVGSRQGMD